MEDSLNTDLNHILCELEKEKKHSHESSQLQFGQAEFNLIKAINGASALVIDYLDFLLDRIQA